mgnify:CR=1 FL=1
MNVNRRRPDDPKEWLSRARSNLLQARVRQKGVYLEDLCFQAQQAAEKAIKAVLIHVGMEYPYSHDLGVLLTLVSQAGVPIPEAAKQAARLTRYAVAGRYPGLMEPVTEEEYRRALQIATDVLEWAEEVITEK